MATIRTAIQLQDNVSQAFKSMNVAMQATINSFEHLHQASGNAMDISSIEIARRELARAEQAFNQIETQISQANAQQNHFNNSLSEGTSAANALLSKLLAIVGAYISLHAAMEIVKNSVTLSDELTNITARLDLMNDGFQTTAELQKMIFHSAQRAYGEYSLMADLVGKLGMNARDAFSSNAETIAFAELLNKQFSIAGTSAEGISAATLQLTQALGSGVLRGEELNSIFEQAPNIIHTIAGYLEVPISKIRDMASEGEITADIVKKAMFTAADDINEKFNNMPLTFSQIWQNFKNEALWAFQDVLMGINDAFNSERFLSFVEGAKSALYVVGNAVLFIFNMLASLGAFVYDNWYWLGPIITGVSLALVTFVSYLLLARGAILAITAAQWAWTAAMAANPIGLVVIGIILLISLFYAGIGALNHFAGTSISATGIIAGTFMVLDALLHNTIAAWWNLFASLVEFWANVWTEPTYTIKRLFGNLANTALDMAISMIGNFDNAATNFANLFIDAANMAIRAINWVSDTINNLTGIDFGKMGEFEQRHSLVADYSGLKNKVNDWVGEAPEGYWEAPKMEMKNIGTAWNTGYNWGENLFGGDPREEKKKEDEGLPWDEILAALGNANGSDSPANKDTAKNTAKMAKSMDGTANELKYLRDLAEREAINRFTTAEIKVDMKNENHINSEMDIDGVIDRFGEKVEETIAVLAEGDSDDV